jgi:BMFP domain-containing protein YqiC
MSKAPTSELFSTLKGYFNALTEGERTPTEVASALNDWARESAESVKAKIAEEVESTVSKMGFVKRDEYDKLVARVSQLEKSPAKKSPIKKAAVKPANRLASKPAKRVVNRSAQKTAKKTLKKASK